MMAAALMTTACSSDDDSTSVTPKPAADQTVKSIPYTVTVGQGTTTRASVDGDDITLRFAEGDELYVEGENGKVYGCLTLQSGDAGKNNGATFSGDLYYTGSEPADDLQLTATLVGINDELANVSGNKVMGFDNYPTTICATMAEAVQKYSKLTGSSTYGEKSFTLSQQTAFLKFKVILEDGTTPGDNAVAVTIKDGNNTLVTGTTVASGTAQFTDTYAEFVLPVADNTTISTEAKMWVGSVGTPTDESIDLGGSNTLAAGNVYEVAEKTKDFVRLWDNGPVWATKNLGATSVSGYGNYYAWGEITGDAQSDSHDFSWANYSLCTGSETTLTRYNNMEYYGTVDNKTEFADYNYEDDAAYAASNGTWRIPTENEFVNLLSNTTGVGATVNTVKGRTFTGKTTGYTGKAIFLPAAGYRMGTSLYDQPPLAAYGDYWSSSYLPYGTPSNGSYLNFGSGGADTGSYARCAGQSVRPVRTN